MFSLQRSFHHLKRVCVRPAAVCGQCGVSSSSQPASPDPSTQLQLNPDSELNSVVSSKAKAWQRELELSLQHPDYFNVLELFTLEELFTARLHLGHRDGTLNPFMTPYILGSRLTHLIIDLDQSVKHLHRALNFLAHIAFRDGIVLFVCRDKQHQLMVEDMATSCGETAHSRFWQEGVLTNSTIQFKGMIRLPDVIVLLSTHNHILDSHTAVKEAAKMLVPTIGVVDTNSDPRLITYPIPGNDDSKTSVGYLSKLFAKTIMIGKEKRKSFLAGLPN